MIRHIPHHQASLLYVFHSLPFARAGLSILASAPATEVKIFAEGLLDALGELRVLANRSGLVVLPATDSAQGAQFHLGEGRFFLSRKSLKVGGGSAGLRDGVSGVGCGSGTDLCLAMSRVKMRAILACDLAWALHSLRHWWAFR